MAVVQGSVEQFSFGRLPSTIKCASDISPKEPAPRIGVHILDRVFKVFNGQGEPV